MKTALRGALSMAFSSCVLLGMLACLARPVHAASPSVSYSTWIISGNTVMLRFVLPVAEAERLTGSAIPVLTASKLGEYLLEHTAVAASGRDCAAINQGYDLGRVDPVRVGAGFYGFEILFRCDEPMRSLVLENRALFDRAPGHVNFARIEAGRRRTDQLFTSGRQRVHIPDPSAVPAAGVAAYVGLGISHVLRDAGRLCFLLAALLALRRPREWLLILGGLAVGYALALAAGASGLIVAEQPMIEAFIGFLVALCAVAAVAPQLARPSIAIAGWPLALLVLAIVAAGFRAPRPALLLAGAAGLSAGFLAAIRPGMRHGIMAVPAAIFGFLDGFSLPSLLAPLDLNLSSRARMSIGHDLGALIAEAGFLALVVGALTLAGGFVRGGGFAVGARLARDGGASDRRSFAAARDLIAAAAGQSPARRTLLEVLAAAMFAGLGIFWLVSRLHA
jgi:HupE / UreJ protein